jgi:hypothetical protein
VKRWGAPALALALFGCGTNRPEIPPELLASDSGVGLGAGCDSPDYPPGPYGSESGALVSNTCFRGWSAPNTSPHTDAALADISFGLFHDPTGLRFELLLVNTAALWCAVCKTEHQALPQHYQDLAPRGLAILSALFQNNAGDPADLNDMKQWVEAFHTNFPMVLDPDYQLGTYGQASKAPLNLVIDARTMQIVEKFVGDQGSVLWPLIEDELARREASK